jgi:hypothetical protein
LGGAPGDDCDEGGAAIGGASGAGVAGARDAASAAGAFACGRGASFAAVLRFPNIG